jgi:capsid protein
MPTIECGFGWMDMIRGTKMGTKTGRLTAPRRNWIEEVDQMKRLIALILAGLLSLSILVACGGQQPAQTEEQKGTTETKTEEATPAETTPEETPPAEETTPEETPPAEGGQPQ